MRVIHRAALFLSCATTCAATRERFGQTLNLYELTRRALLHARDDTWFKTPRMDTEGEKFETIETHAVWQATWSRFAKKALALEECLKTTIR